jgi:hypothetical protein
VPLFLCVGHQSRRLLIKSSRAWSSFSAREQHSRCAPPCGSNNNLLAGFWFSLPYHACVSHCLCTLSTTHFSQAALPFFVNRTCLYPCLRPLGHSPRGTLSRWYMPPHSNRYLLPPQSARKSELAWLVAWWGIRQSSSVQWSSAAASEQYTQHNQHKPATVEPSFREGVAQSSTVHGQLRGRKKGADRAGCIGVKGKRGLRAAVRGREDGASPQGRGEVLCAALPATLRRSRGRR